MEPPFDMDRMKPPWGFRQGFALLNPACAARRWATVWNAFGVERPARSLNAAGRLNAAGKSQLQNLRFGLQSTHLFSRSRLNQQAPEEVGLVDQLPSPGLSQGERAWWTQPFLSEVVNFKRRKSPPPHVERVVIFVFAGSSPRSNRLPANRFQRV